MAVDRSDTQPKSCVFFTGIKHCGKTTVGKITAEEWGVPFFDLDDLVEKSCADETGSLLSCRDIYREYGKPSFLWYEAAAAKRLEELAGPRARREAGESSSPAGIRAVAALGGGTIENGDAISVLQGFGLFVLLDADPEELFARIKRGGIPPFLRGGAGSPGGKIERKRDIYAGFLELYTRRMKLYKRQADIIIDTRGKPPREIAGEAVRHIPRHLRGTESGRKE
jgi:shikimate kinase